MQGFDLFVLTEVLRFGGSRKISVFFTCISFSILPSCSVCTGIGTSMCMDVYEHIYKYSGVFHWGEDFPFLTFSLNVRDTFLCYFLCIPLAEFCVSMHWCNACVYSPCLYPQPPKPDVIIHVWVTASLEMILIKMERKYKECINL